MTLRDPIEYVVVQIRAYFAHFSSTLWTFYSAKGDETMIKGVRFCDKITTNNLKEDGNTP
jgi:hypothetical protein